MLRLRQFLTLAGLTALEVVRQPICLLLVTACLVLIAVTSLVLMHTFGDGGELARDSGLAYHLVFGVFIAATAACSTLSRDMRRGTAAVVMSKPVSRELFFVSKFAGVAAIVVSFSACAMVTTLMGERVAEKFYHVRDLHGWIQDVRTGVSILVAVMAAYVLGAWVNYRFRRSFVSTAFALLFFCLLIAFFVSGLYEVDGKPAAYDLRVDWRTVSAGALVALALLVLSAMALAFSTRLRMVGTVSCSAVVLVVGLLSDYLVGSHVQASAVARLLYVVIPNWQHFWAVDLLRDGGAISTAYMVEAVLYAGLYGGAVLVLGLVSFRHSEVK